MVTRANFWQYRDIISGCFASAADAFRGIYKDRHKDGECALPMIHVYGFSKARDPEFDFHEVSSDIFYISLGVLD